MLFLSVIIVLCGVAHGRMLKRSEFNEQIIKQEIEGIRQLADQFCTTPVAKQIVNFPATLVGRANPPIMYSGYVNITTVDYYFYWLFQNKLADADAPLVIWTNG